MLHESPDNLDALIRAEKERVAQEMFQEAWDDALAQDIEPAILAEQALTMVLRELNVADGESAVATLVEQLPDRVESGHFLPHRSLQ